MEEEPRDIQMQALRDQFAPGGGFVFGPSGAKEGGTFWATKGEAKNYAEKAPHLAKRLTAEYVAPGDVPADRTWADTGYTFGPEEYLRKFPSGPDAVLAKAEIAKAAAVAPPPVTVAKPAPPAPIPQAPVSPPTSAGSPARPTQAVSIEPARTEKNGTEQKTVKPK